MRNTFGRVKSTGPFTRRYRSRLVASAVALSAIASLARAANPLVTADDMAAAKTLADSYDRQPPFSFTYDGKPSSEFLSSWKQETRESIDDLERVHKSTTWTDAASGLAVTLNTVRYHDYPAIEWTATLKAGGTGDTKRIDDLRGIDAIVGHASATSSTAPKHTAWNAGTNFPQSATGSPIEFFRGWVNAWKPMDKSAARYDAAGQAPWIAKDPSDPTAVILSPAQGIEGASDAAGSGKSPGLVFRAPVDGLYRVSGKIAMTTNAGDGVEWDLHASDGAALGSKNLDAGQSDSFSAVRYLNAHEAFVFTMNSRGNTTGDLARVNFNITQITSPSDGDIVVHVEKGSDARDSDYQPLPIGIGANESIALESAGGRGSDGVAIPYFNLEMPGTSACLAIGWPGQWDASFARVGGDVRVSAGQQQVHAILHPGEEIRTPLIAMVAYSGNDVQRGQNIWRRWMIEHNMPRVDGKLVGPFLAANTSHETKEVTRATTANQIDYIDGYAKRGIKFDYWWMDAGWYEAPGYPPTYVGTWKVDRTRFADGLRTIFDHAHSKGIKSIVWFEPERVLPGTELANEHPNFLLPPPIDPNDPARGLEAWTNAGDKTEPNAVFNPSSEVRTGANGVIRWSGKMLALHPGPNGEFGVARFVVPADGKYKIDATFGACDPRATTDVHILHANRSLLAGIISPAGSHDQHLDQTLTANKGDAILFAVGWGENRNIACDGTSLAATITGPDGIAHDVSAEFDLPPADRSWSVGSIPAGDPAQVASSFQPFAKKTIAGDPTGGTHLLNLGDPSVREWITNRIDTIIKTEGIDVYRQDFNMAPLDYWRRHDSIDRQGITENFYVQGYLKYWDTLRERNPKIYIDSCASGGRRNDLETMRRATPFLRSDQVFYPTGQQSHTLNCSQWLPLNGTGILLGQSVLVDAWKYDVDPYVFRSDMSSITIIGTDVLNDAHDWKQFAALVKQYQELSPDYLADLYPLTESTIDPGKWMGWEFYSPERGSGFVQAFRREGASEPAAQLKLRGLDREASYDVTDVDHADQSRTLSGAALMDQGLNVSIEAKPGAAVIRIRKK